MTAYVIVDIDVTDPTEYEEYKKLAPAAVELYRGKYIARRQDRNTRRRLETEPPGTSGTGRQIPRWW